MCSTDQVSSFVCSLTPRPAAFSVIRTGGLFMSQLNVAERTMQFWSVLVMAARTQRFVSYNMLEQITGVVSQGQSTELGTIFTYCQKNHLPILSCIVVSHVTGRPIDQVLNEFLSDLEAEQRRVFVYDWLSRGCPSLDELQAAEAELKVWEAANA
jgi:hypothetical protein